MSAPKNCPGRESFQRINYLYQLSNGMATQSEATNVASTMYTNLLNAVAKKSVQRLDINCKRTICKGCRCLLLAGITCKVRIKKKRSRWTCLQCRTVKVFDLRDTDYRTWSQQDESVVEVQDYGGAR